MFDREEFINKYIELLKTKGNDEDAVNALTAKLPQDMTSDYYIGITEELIHTLKSEDAITYEDEIKRLENTVALMRFMADMADEQMKVKKDSNNTKGEATSKPKQEANEAPADVVTTKAEDTASVEVAEVDGEAPTKEVEEKS